MTAFPPYRNFYLPALSATDIQKRSAHPKHLVIIPLGAIEQHGPHLPVGTDSLIGELLLDGMTNQMEAKLPLCIAPPLTFTKSNEHTGFPGTLFIQKESLIVLLSSYLGELVDMGFKSFAFLNTHGGNTSWLRVFLQERNSHPDHKYCMLNPMPEIQLDLREATYGIHAGEYESSLLYHAIPEACHPEKADCQWIDKNLSHPDLRPEFAPVTFAWVASDLTPSGTMGDATQATAEKGERWIAAAVKSLVEQVAELMQ
jgi:creatinine amidohydrolase